MATETTEGSLADDKGLLAEVMAPEPAGKPSPIAETKIEPPAAEPAAKVDEQKDHRVPLRDLLDERDRYKSERQQREALERKIAELRAKPKDPNDFFVDPDAYLGAQVKSVEQRFLARFVDGSFEDAKEADPEKFDKAWNALVGAVQGGDAALRERIVQAPNPGKALLRWHQQQEALAQYGTDPAAYVEKQKAEWMKNPEIRAAILAEIQAEASGTMTGSRPSAVKLPPSLNSATTASRGGDAEPMTDRELHQDALRRRR